MELIGERQLFSDGRKRLATQTQTRGHPSNEMIAFHATAFYSLEKNLFHILDKTAAKDTGKKGRGFNNAT